MAIPLSPRSTEMPTSGRLIDSRAACTEYIFYCKRAILFLSSSKILTPHPPLRPASLSSSRNKGSPGGEEDRGSIFWKTREIGLSSCSKICTLWKYDADNKLVAGVLCSHQRINLSPLSTTSSKKSRFFGWFWIKRLIKYVRTQCIHGYPLMLKVQRRRSLNPTEIEKFPTFNFKLLKTQQNISDRFK